MKALMKAALTFFTITASIFTHSQAAYARDKLSYEAFDKRMESTKALLDEGDAAAALIEFEYLSSVSLFESPNYEPYFYIAKAKNSLGNIVDASSNLQQFKCMIRVLSGAKKCSNAYDYGRSTPDNIIKFESDFTDLELCYQTMCPGLFHSYYIDPSKKTLLEIANFWSEVDYLRTKIETER